MTLRFDRHRLRRRASRRAFPAAILAICAGVHAPAQEGADPASLDELVRSGMVEVIERRAGELPAGLRDAAMARACANRAAALSDPAERQAMFERSGESYADWIRTIEARSDASEAQGLVAIASACEEFGAMLLWRSAAEDLAAFEISDGRMGDRDRLARLLREAVEQLDRASVCAQALNGRLDRDRRAAEQEYLALGIYDEVLRLRRDVPSHSAWAALRAVQVASASSQPADVLAFRRPEEKFREAIAARPDSGGSRLHVGLAIALRLQDRSEEARAAATHALRTADGPAEDAAARCELARVHLSARRYQEARAILRPVLAVAVGGHRDSGAGSFDENLAAVLDAKSTLAESDTLRFDPADAAISTAMSRKAARLRDEGLGALARLSLRGGSWPELIAAVAESSFRHGAPSDDASCAEWFLWAHRLSREGPSAESIRAWTRAADAADAADPLRSESRLAAARALHEMESAGAADAYLRFATESPDHPEAARAAELACAFRVRDAERSRTPEAYAAVRAAADALRSAFPQHPRGDWAQWVRAIALEGEGRLAEAAAAYSEFALESPYGLEAGYRGLMCRAEAWRRASITASEPERRVGATAVAAALETFAERARGQATDPARRDEAVELASLATLEAARLLADPAAGGAERALKLLDALAEPSSKGVLRDAALSMRIDLLTRLDRIEEALLLVRASRGSDAVSAGAAPASILAAIDARLDALERDGDPEKLRSLVRAARDALGDLPESTPGTESADARTVAALGARLLALDGEPERATAIADELLRAAPSDGNLLRLRAQCLTARAKRSGAHEDAARARSAWEKLLEDESLAVSAAERFWEARYAVLTLRLSEGRADEVASAVRQERIWRPELGGPSWRDQFLELERRAIEAAGGSTSRP